MIWPLSACHLLPLSPFVFYSHTGLLGVEFLDHKLNPSQGLCIFQCLQNPPSPHLHGLFLNLFNSLLKSFFQKQLFLTVLGLHFRAGFSLVEVSRGYSLSQRTGSSLQWLLLLQSSSSRVHGLSSCSSQALEHRLYSCGSWSQLLYGIWDLPGPGIELMSLELAGCFFTIEPPGQPYAQILIFKKDLP